MMETISMEIAAAINQMVADGCQFPIYMTTVAANGAMLGARYEMDDGEVKCHFVFEEYPVSGFRTPINIMFTDGTTKDFRVLIEGPQEISRKWMN